MNTRVRSVYVYGVLAAFGLSIGMSAAPPTASAVDLGDLLKAGGIALLVQHFGDDINHFINGVLSQKGIEHQGMTKVVPVVALGSGRAGVGAAQVVGPAEQVAKVQAVAELQLNIGRSVRARALLPITTKRFETSSVKGVGGVGVSANIKHPL